MATKVARSSGLMRARAPTARFELFVVSREIPVLNGVRNVPKFWSSAPDRIMRTVAVTLGCATLVSFAMTEMGLYCVGDETSGLTISAVIEVSPLGEVRG
jgi:hypothetical protein